MGDEKAVAELKTAIDAIDFDGGLTSVSATPATPEQKPAEETPSTLVTPTKSDPVEKETPVVVETLAEKPAEEEVESTPAKTEESPADDKPAIPDSHYRAAVHMGMKAEEIGELYDQSPELALKALAKCYEMVNASSKQLGELGQQARRLKEPAPVTPVQPSRKEAVMKKLKEKYEDDPIIDLIGELIPDAPAPRPAVQPVQQQPPERSIDEEIAVRQTINTFFGADDMKPYEDFYGKAGQAGDWTHLTGGQVANRRETCNRAQLILDGAEATGMKMSAAEALERAHLEVAAPMVEQVVRQRIVKSVQKRAAGVTLKPSGSRTPAPAAGAYNHEQAVQEVGAELKKVFGSP